MKLFMVFASEKDGWEDRTYFEEVFLTREKAEEYINKIDEIDKEYYDYDIFEREVI